MPENQPKTAEQLKAEVWPRLELPAAYAPLWFRHPDCDGCYAAAHDAVSALERWPDSPLVETWVDSFKHAAGLARAEEADQMMQENAWALGLNHGGRTLRFGGYGGPKRRGVVVREIAHEGWEVQWLDTNTIGFVNNMDSYYYDFEDAPMDRAQVDAVRAQMDVGARIRVIKTLEDFNGIQPGMHGTVTELCYPNEQDAEEDEDPTVSNGVRAELDDGTSWAFLYCDDAWERVT